MPNMSKEERAVKIAAGMARNREKDKLTVKDLERLISLACEFELNALRIAVRVMNGNQVNDTTRIRAGCLADEAAKTIVRLVESAAKLGIKPEAVVAPEPEAKVEPDYGE